MMEPDPRPDEMEEVVNGEEPDYVSTSFEHTKWMQDFWRNERHREGERDE